MGKLKYALLENFHPCCVLRASVNQTMGIHSFYFSSVLRAACKYELAFSLQIQHVQMYSTITVSLYVRYTYTVCANTYTRTVGANTVHTDTVGKSMGTQEKWKIQIRKYESCIEVDAYNNRIWFYWK